MKDIKIRISVYDKITQRKGTSVRNMTKVPECLLFIPRR